MFRDTFIDLPEWQKILAVVGEWREYATESMRNAGDFATTRYFAGQLDVFDAIESLPERLFKNEDHKPEIRQPEGTVDLPNHPRATRVLY